MSRNPLIPIFLTIIMVNSLAAVMQKPHLLDNNLDFHASSSPTPNEYNYTDFGNGSAANSFWVGSDDSGIQDTWLSASQPDTNYGTDSELRTGFSANASSRWNSLVGIDLNKAGMFDNVTVQSATLALYVKQLSGQPTIRSWICYDNSWDATITDWNDWNIGGALGNQDSGKMMDEISIVNQGWVEIDVTDAILTSHYHYRTGGHSTSSILLTGPAWGEEWASFHSSEYSVVDLRPHLNVTYSWGTSSPPSNGIEWVDVYPKVPYRIDADNQLLLEAQARTGIGQTASGVVSWSANHGSIDTSGLFTPIEAGVTQIDATIGGVTGSLNLQVTPGTPVNLDLETKSIALTIDDNYQFNWTFVDSNGNEVVSAALTWYADYGNVNETGFYQPTTIGQDMVTVMWQSLFATADIDVSAGIASILSIQPNLSVASGEQIPLVYTVTDRLGNPLPNGAEGSVTWEAENGYVDGVGIYTGDAVGLWRINATSTSGASGHTFVEVTPGELSSIELVTPNGSQAADQPVLLIVNWLDVRGNKVPVRIPLSNWTAEDGNFRMTPEGVEWLPRREGDWNVGVHVEDQWANTTINVVHGSIDRLLITSDTEIISADTILDLQLMAEDSKGNRWLVEGTWDTVEPVAAPWLSQSGNSAQFSGNIVGNWTVRAEYSNFSSEITLVVVPGSLAKIELQGDGALISADGWQDFAPKFYDEDGNELFDIQLNWTFQHDGQQFDRSGEIRSNNGVWYPVLAGHHEIEVEAAGVFASLGIDVTPGIAHTLRALQPNGVVVVDSGNITEIQVNATDLDGNDFGTDVIWTIPHNSVQLTNGSRAGEYLIRGIRAGNYVLQFQSGLADSEITVIVQPGEIINLEINIVNQDVKTGEIIDLEIIALDFGGNKIEINPDEVSITSSAGSFGHSSGNYWQMVIENSGSQQRIQANYDSAQGEAFIDVSADPLRAFGDSSFATSLWTAITAVILMFVLLLFLLKRRGNTERAALEHHFGSKETQEEQTNFDPMAGYKPSKKARAAAQQAFNQRFPQLGHASWSGYNQAQMNSPVMQQQNHANVQMQIAETEDVSKDDDSELQSEEQLDESPWTTEQVWQWGRSQGWNDEQIAAYEQIYDESVRNPKSLESNIENIQENIEVDEQQNEEINPEPEIIEEEVVDDSKEIEDGENKQDDVREKGVMKAMPGTTQGEAGWYLDWEGNPSRWDIDDDGQWHRTG
ncbi:MAG: hypothetical protein CMA77_04325 [Euryarchaeota archaeon]|nr:hypothetical protein [Euryarchaeota archaeon]